MCEGIVEKVKFPNKGIVKVEDSEVTVKNTIPGDSGKVRTGECRS